MGWWLTVTAAVADNAAIVGGLINPTRLAALGPRGANSRVQKCVYWLTMARRAQENVTNTLDHAIASVGYTNTNAARLTRDALLRNLDIAEKLGCLDPDGLSEMRRGRAATIRRGPYSGDQLSVDHIIPRAVCPELDNVIANLEFMPMRMNSAKGDRISTCQIALAQTFQQAGLLPLMSLSKIHSP